MSGAVFESRGLGAMTTDPVPQDAHNGQAAEEVLANGRYVVGRKIASGSQADTADILDYLHSRVPPVIHRDIKPGNII